LSRVTFKKSYHAYTRKKMIFIAACCILTFALLCVSLSIGKYELSVTESYRIFINILFGRNKVVTMADEVVWEMRLPRSMMAVSVGAGLSVAGAAMQSLLKNPLADPYTTGVSSGASFGASIAIVYGFCLLPSITGQNAIIVNAFLLSLIPSAVMVALNIFKKNTTATTTILTGIAIMYVFSAMTAMIKLLAKPESLSEVYIWSVGTLGKATWDNIGVVTTVVISGSALLMLVSRHLNVSTSGDKLAATLGININALRVYLLVVISFMTSAIVSFTGTIGFVGLAVPHMVRRIIGSENRYLLPASMAFGAVFLLLCDIIARSVGTTGLPVGTITALFGGPLFIYLLIKENKLLKG